MPNTRKKTVQEIVELIHAMDLGPIKFKLMDAEEGCGWSREYADRMETEYKRFLVLSVKHPDELISPSKEVDKFWHGHILDTLKYAEDCDHVFGYFVHHFPYVGLRGEEDAAKRAAGALTMRRLYQQEFGGTLSGASETASYCGIAAASYCGIANAKADAVTEQASYCGIAAASYCGIACGEAKSAVDQSGYCGIANNILDVTNRPALPRA